MRWPKKIYGSSRSRMLVDPASSGLRGGWNMKPVNGVVVDQSANHNDGTIHGCSHSQTLLGDSFHFNGVSNFVDFGNVGTIKSFTCWVKPQTTTEDIADFDGSTHTIEVNAGTLTATGWAAPVIYVNGEVTSVLATNIWQYIQITTETGFAANAFLLGKETTYLDGYICAPIINSDTLSATNALQGYQEGHSALHFKSDWGVHESIVSEGGAIGNFLSNSPLRFGDAVGRFKFETDEIEGNVCKVVTCQTAGLLYSPTELFTTPVEAAFGRFNLWLNKDKNSDLKIGLVSTNPNVNLGYGIHIDIVGSCTFEEWGVGNIIDCEWIDYSQWYNFEVKIKRIAANNEFELFVNNVSKGTGTDATFTESNYIVFDLDAGDKISWSDLSGGHNIIKGVIA